MIDMNPSDNDQRVSTDTFDIHAIDPLIRPLIPYFAELTTERIQGLRDALVHGNFEQIKRLAHTIKGSAASYGFPNIADVAARIEQALQKSDRAELTGPLIERLAELHAALLRTIELSPELFQDDEDDEDA